MNSRTKKIWIVISFFIVGLVGLVLFLMPGHQPESLQLSKPLVHNVRYPSVIANNKLDFFTGSSFVSLNLSDYSTSALTPVMSLPVVSDVKWSTNGALFKASGYSYQDQLSPTIIAHKLDPSKAYWWSITWAQSPKPQLVGIDSLAKGQDVLDASWSREGDIIYAVKSVNGSTSEFRQQPDSPASTPLANIDKVDYILWSDNNSVVTANGTSSSQFTITAHSIAGQQIFQESAVNLPAVSSDGQIVAFNKANKKYPNTELGIGDLYLKNVATKKIWLVQKKFTGYIRFDPDGSLVIHQLSGSPNKNTDVLVFGNDHKLKKYQTKNTPFTLAPLSLKSASNTPVVYGTDDKHDLYILAKEAASNPNWQATVPFTQSVWQDRFSIQYDDIANKYVVTILAGPYETSRLAVLEYFRNQNLNYNQLDIIWQGSPSVTHFN